MLIPFPWSNCPVVSLISMVEDLSSKVFLGVGYLPYLEGRIGDGDALNSLGYEITSGQLCKTINTTIQSRQTSNYLSC